MTILPRAFRTALAFLTRLPVGRHETRDDDLGSAIAFFPLVGLVLGGCLAGAVWLLATNVPPLLTAVALTGLLAVLTGGLHLDGLADVFDGLGGGHGDRARSLAIMRDGRIGAHGAVALILVLVAKIIALGLAARQRDVWLLVMFPAVGRWSVVPLIVGFPYVRKEGLGRGFSDHGSRREIVWATLSIVVMIAFAGTRFIAPALAALGVALLFGLWLRRRLGGLTGDVYGAAIELAEVACLAAAVSGR